MLWSDIFRKSFFQLEILSRTPILLSKFVDVIRPKIDLLQKNVDVDSSTKDKCLRLLKPGANAAEVGFLFGNPIS